MSKKLGLSLVLVFVLAVLVFVLAMGVSDVQAGDTSATPLPPSFHDGRLNAYDAGAPVAVFNTRDTIATVDSKGLATTKTVISGIQLLAWNGGTKSAQQVLYVPRDVIEKAIAKNTKVDFTVAKDNGYTLNYSQSGWFWITTPPNSEGKVYTFSWKKDF